MSERKPVIKLAALRLLVKLYTNLQVSEEKAWDKLSVESKIEHASQREASKKEFVEILKRYAEIENKYK